MNEDTPTVGPFEIGTYYKSTESVLASDPSDPLEVRVPKGTIWFAARPVLKISPVWRNGGVRVGSRESVHAPHVRMICRDHRSEDHKFLYVDVRVYLSNNYNSLATLKFSQIKSPLMVLALAADEFVI